jgi:1,4-dihydroxy-2-naphthoate octaprenyltransferase
VTDPATRTPAALWWQGARPRTLGAAVAPVLVGTAAAGTATVPRTVGALAVALGLQVGVNYANDYFDGMKGVDSAARVGPVRLVASGAASPRAVAAAAAVAFGVAAVVGVALALATEPVLLLVGGGALLAAVLYSGGPRPYGALGFGELSVFAFFGLAATAGTAYVQAGQVPAQAWWASVPVGLLAVAILVANNLRDIPTDAVSGKRTLAVRLGEERTRWLYRATVIGAFAAIGLGVALEGLPVEALVALLALPLAALALAGIGMATGRELVPVLIRTAALHLLTGLLLVAGLWLA